MQRGEDQSPLGNLQIAWELALHLSSSAAASCRPAQRAHHLQHSTRLLPQVVLLLPLKALTRVCMLQAMGGEDDAPLEDLVSAPKMALANLIQ